MTLAETPITPALSPSAAASTAFASPAASQRPLAYETDLSEQLARIKPSMLFQGSTPEELHAWQVSFRETLRRLLWEIPERAPLDFQIEDETDCGSYVRRRVSYQTEPLLRVPAWLLVPKSALGEASDGQSTPAPGVLFLHGHSDFGKDNVVGINSSVERRAELDLYRMGFGPALAEAGFVVLAPDLRGFGERYVDYPNPRFEYCPRNFMVAALMGTTVVAQHFCDLTAALDVLGGLPETNGHLACARAFFGWAADDAAGGAGRAGGGVCTVGLS